MLSYLHSFHAGNAADVLKHSVLIFCLEYLKKKEKPILCVDTHAGAGFYDLTGKGIPLNREWEKGLGRLFDATDITPLLASYVNLVSADSCYPAVPDSCIPVQYPGSPVIMAKILGKGDRLVCFELHPREAEALKNSMAEIRSNVKPAIEVHREDGPGGLKSLLPPPSRRGLILIDPSWEEKDEYESIPGSVELGLKRFPEGTFIIWYPLLAMPKSKSALSAPVQDTLFNLSKGNRCRMELSIRMQKDHAETGNMYGCGLVIYNPPWTLRSVMEETLPCLVKVLGEKGASWRLDWEGA